MVVIQTLCGKGIKIHPCCVNRGAPALVNQQVRFVVSHVCVFSQIAGGKISVKAIRSIDIFIYISWLSNVQISESSLRGDIRIKSKCLDFCQISFRIAFYAEGARLNTV